MRVVVGALLVRDGRLLAAQRTHPPETAGRWELPGGGVEPGEDDPTALARECAEELGIAVTVGDRFGPDVPLGADRLLRVHVCTTVDEPTAREHAELRWLTPGELTSVDWLPADRALFDAVAARREGSDGPSERTDGGAPGPDATAVALAAEIRRLTPS